MRICLDLVRSKKTGTKIPFNFLLTVCNNKKQTFFWQWHLSVILTVALNFSLQLTFIRSKLFWIKHLSQCTQNLKVLSIDSCKCQARFYIKVWNLKFWKLKTLTELWLIAKALSQHKQQALLCNKCSTVLFNLSSAQQ